MTIKRKTDERGYDIEIVPLIDALNTLQGVETFESCSGHGKHEIHIWLKAEFAQDLMLLVEILQEKNLQWTWEILVEANFSNFDDPIHYFLRGPVGAYAEADWIATTLSEENVVQAH